MPIAPEVLIPRLGDVLVQEGILTPEQLIVALQYQKEQRLQGNNLLIGQALVEIGFIDQKTLDQSVTHQIMMLQDGLKKANESLEQRVQERTQELEIAYKKLSELSELKANFIANISHEFRTPLTHITGYIDLLLSDGFGSLNKEQKKAIDVLKRASMRLERLIDDLILYSTSEVNKLVVNKEVFNISDLLEEVKQKVNSLAEKNKIQIAIESPSHPALVKADRSKILWAVNHLVDNALKFSNPGGKIILQTKSDEKKVTIHVIDNGIGIEPQKIEEIFELFYQLDSSSTRRQGGTGLGLALVRRIIEAHGEKITVKSEPGKGSDFSFSLDRVQNAE